MIQSQVRQVLFQELQEQSQTSDARYLHVSSYVLQFREYLRRILHDAADLPYHVRLSGCSSVS